MSTDGTPPTTAATADAEATSDVKPPEDDARPAASAAAGARPACRLEQSKDFKNSTPAPRSPAARPSGCGVVAGRCSSPSSA